jgi:hypothetical protein
VPPPLVPLGDQDVAPEILQNLVDLDRFPKHLPIHVQLPHRTRRRTEKVAAVPRQGNVREDGGALLVVRFPMGAPGEVEGFVDVGDIAGKETADDGRQRKEASVAWVVADGLQGRTSIVI